MNRLILTPKFPVRSLGRKCAVEIKSSNWPFSVCQKAMFRRRSGYGTPFRLLTVEGRLEPAPHEIDGIIVPQRSGDRDVDHGLVVASI